MTKYIYSFQDGNIGMIKLLGGKGAGLAEMAHNNIPLPPGFVITTEACNNFFKDNKLSNGMKDELVMSIRRLEKATGKKLGDQDNPLLISVRSGAPVSMPGMLDTILNVGLTKNAVLRATSRDVEFLTDSYIRLIRMYAKVIHGVELPILRTGPQEKVTHFLEEFRTKTGNDFPDDPNIQLQNCIIAVFNSWLSQKATGYRQMYGVSKSLGTAVVIQAMVFGNKGNDSGTGVVFSRDPATGKKQLFGEYMLNAQGEDLVSGVTTPKPIVGMKKDLPDAYEKLLNIIQKLETIFKDAQDIEFTIENGKLFILQTRAAKRTPIAAVKIAVDLAQEGMISNDDAVKRISPAMISQLLSPRFEDDPEIEEIAQGIPSSPGGAVGRVALTKEKVKELTSKGESVIFVRENTSPDDVPVMPMVAGILTQHGGATSHAAVVARGIGKPCIVGCESLNVDIPNNFIKIKDHVIREGEFISIDGESGSVFKGQKKLIGINKGEFKELTTLTNWVDSLNTTRILPVASTAFDVAFAVEEGLKEIGLLRTEWMFNNVQFRSVLRESLLSLSDKKKASAFQSLEDLQSKESKLFFEAMGNGKISVRLLSTSVEDFLPIPEALLIELTELKWSEGWNARIGLREQELRQINALMQINPRFGIRGARLFLTMPELAKIQLRALFIGLCQAIKQRKANPSLRILIPCVTTVEELSAVIKFIDTIAGEVSKQMNTEFSYQTGAIIDTPRAILISDQIAKLVDCIYIDTAELTESVFSFSRDDENKFMPYYISQGLLPFAPLKELDIEGVGQFIKTGVEKIKRIDITKPVILCGPHCSTQSVAFFSNLGIDGFCVDISKTVETKFSFAQSKISK